MLGLPIRMTVLRLASGDMLMHSPTRFDARLKAEIEAHGPIRHLVAPNIAHWSFLAEWQRHVPDAVTWAVPGLRGRANVKASGVRLDRDLPSESAPDRKYRVPRPRTASSNRRNLSAHVGRGGHRYLWLSQARSD